MSSIVLSGLTTITTIQLFDGWDQIADILDDIRKIGCWINSQLPENRFICASIYAIGSIAFLRSIPFILRRTSFFAYHEREMLYFHRSNNNKEIVELKKVLLNELNDVKSVGLPLFQDEKLVILEINAGSGTNASYFPDDSYVIATDSLEGEKEKFEKNVLLEGDESKLNVHSYIETIPEELAGVPDDSVSCVISFHSLCNARKKERALDEIYRVLMPNGRLYFIEHTTVKERFTFLWLAQLNFRPTMFLLSCCIDTPENYIEKSNFSKVSYKQIDIDMSRARGPLVSLVPHVYGYAIK